MSIRRWGVFGLLTVLALALSGCQATPPTVEDRGIHRAMTDAEVAASETVSNALLPFEEIKSQNGREIDTVLTGEDGTALTIKAKVSVAQVDEVPLLALKNANIDIELAKHALFGDRAEEATKDDSQDEYASNGSETWKLPPDADQAHGASLIWSVLSEGRGTILMYYNDDGAILYDGFPDDDILAQLEDVPTPNEQDCGALLDEKLGQLGLDIQGHTPKMQYSSNVNTKTGSYSLTFVPEYGCLPAVADGQTHIAFMGTVTFSVKGMVDLYLSNLKYPEKTGAVDEMLGIDQALDIVREHLGKGLNPRQDKAVERIDLCYRYVQDTVTEEYSADPVWLFYMEADPLMSGDYSNSTGKQAKRVKYDECFVVDVRSGLLEVVSTSLVEVT